MFEVAGTVAKVIFRLFAAFRGKQRVFPGNGGVGVTECLTLAWRNGKNSSARGTPAWRDGGNSSVGGTPVWRDEGNRSVWGTLTERDEVRRTVGSGLLGRNAGGRTEGMTRAGRLAPGRTEGTAAADRSASVRSHAWLRRPLIGWFESYQPGRVRTSQICRPRVAVRRGGGERVGAGVRSLASCLLSERLGTIFSPRRLRRCATG